MLRALTAMRVNRVGFFGVGLLVLAGVLAVGAFAPRAVHAQSQGFAVNRYDISEVGSDWFSGDSLDLRGGFRPGLRLGIDWAHKPLVRYDADGNEIAAVIEDQVNGHIGVAAMIAGRLRLGFNLPLVLSQSGEQVMANGMTFGTASSFAVGDLRIAADLRLVGEYGDPISLVI